TGHAPEYRKEKVRKDPGIFLRGSRGQRGDPIRGLYGKFAGILQVEIRQYVSSARMLMIIFCEESILRPTTSFWMATSGRGSDRGRNSYTWAAIALEGFAEIAYRVGLVGEFL